MCVRSFAVLAWRRIAEALRLAGTAYLYIVFNDLFRR